MNCPVCSERMREITKHNVEVDICPSCKGVWLDRGELEKIIERVSSDTGQAEGAVPPASPVPRDFDIERDQRYHDERPRHHDDDHDKHNGYGHQRRKGWLSELFD
jgi:uncharacterized protein